MSLKICTIGGGSSYTPELIEGFILRYKSLPVTEICLVDIKEGLEKLEIIGKLAGRMVEKAGLPIKIVTTLDLEEGLKGADFVTTQIRVGGIDARICDERITKKNGLVEQETNGPVGLFKAKRTIPVILDIADKMVEICPNAWLINFTNPSGIVSEALQKHSKNKKVIGLCNVPFNMHKTMADLLEVSIDRLKIDFLGLNHFVYGLNIELDGKDCMKRALEVFCDNPVVPTMKNIAPIVWDKDFVNALNAYPSPYHRYFYMHKAMLLESSKKEKVRGEVVKEVEESLFLEYADENLCEKPAHLQERGGAYYSDSACSLINSIYNDLQDIQVVNTRNQGVILGIDDDSAIEVSAKITKDGPVPIKFESIPSAIYGPILQMKTFEKLVVESVMEENDHKAILALSTNHFVQDIDKAKEVYFDLLEQHKTYK